tara:strand:- start:144 stop:473 length:330 start_codon:yes stop_codon:yes gene_type:complete
MKDLKDVNIMYADFKDWLTLPLTQAFMEGLTKRKDLLLENAAELTYQTYYKKEVNETATLMLGKADGIITILAAMEDCKNDNLEEDNQKIATYHTIHDLLQQPFKTEND